MNAVALAKIAIFFSVLLSSGGRSASTAEVKYIPRTESDGVFNVVYNNEAGGRFVLQILDEDGDQLYQNTFTDAPFNRNFRLADPDSYPKLVFIIRNPGDHSYQRFEVATKTQMVEEVNVEEVKK